MAKVCEMCGKSTMFGRRIRHHHAVGWMYRAPKTNRKWKPNLRKVTVEKDGVPQKMTVCMSCYKTLRKEK
jgi:large subunit ribosomal protein L28